MGGKTEAREDVLCLSHLSFVKWRKETFCNNEWLEAGDELNNSTFNVKVKTLRSEEERFPGIMKTQRSCFFYCKSNYLFSLQRCWCEASFHSREMITRSFHPASKTHIERTDHIFHLNAPIQFIWNIMSDPFMFDGGQPQPHIVSSSLLLLPTKYAWYSAHRGMRGRMSVWPGPGPTMMTQHSLPSYHS